MIANMTNQKTYPGTSGSNVLMKPSLRCVCSSCFGVVCSTDGLLAGLQPEAQVRSFILKKAPRIPAGLEKEEWSNSASYEKTHKSETYKSQEGRCGCCMASTELTGLGSAEVGFTAREIRCERLSKTCGRMSAVDAGREDPGAP
jgi:hypothetical protein